MDDQRLEEIAEKVVAFLTPEGERPDAEDCGAVSDILRAALSSQEEELRLARGVVAAQDERERRAAEACGVAYEPHGCDWPDAVAERVKVLEEELRSMLRERREAETASCQGYEAAVIRAEAAEAELQRLREGMRAVVANAFGSGWVARGQFQESGYRDESAGEFHERHLVETLKAFTGPVPQEG